MYSTCLFCHANLGTNEVIEHFPVGRRLAFDAAKGRLWVVCARCERWNLTPLEERWEAIEECERLFSGTRLRVSTDNIGLAKLHEGLVLVRIGGALRPEMAAWRYGDQFGRRRRKYFAVTGASIAAVGGLMMIGPATGILAGAGWGTWQIANFAVEYYHKRRPRVKLVLPGGERVVTLRKNHLAHTALARDEEGWMLELSYDPGKSSGGATYQMLRMRGTDALRVAGQVLPGINESGASKQRVQDAVRLLEGHADPSSLFAAHADAPRSTRTRRSRRQSPGAIAGLPVETRLALEMAAHEEQERRALEGELAILEAAWRQAEEVAQISDDMFLPDGTSERLEGLRSGRT